MAFQNPPDDVIRELLTTTRTIAMVGASPNPARTSHGIMRRLLADGYRVIPVRPGTAEVLGQRAYATLAEIPEPVDLVNVFRRAEATPPIAEAAVAIGAKALWLQQGIISEEAASIAQAGGLVVVMDACIAVLHRVLGVPRRQD